MIGFSTLTEEDLRYNFGSDLTAGSDYNGSYMQALDLGYVSFQFDDTQCDSDHKFASVSSISYKYADAEYSDGTASETGFEISGNALEYGYSEEFGAAVVKLDLKAKLFRQLAGWSEDESWYSYIYYSDYCSFIDSLRRSTLEMTFNFSDATSLTVDVNINEANTFTLNPDGYTTGRYLSDTINIGMYQEGFYVIKLAHSKDIDMDSMLEFENAILAMQEKETTNKYYADIDSKTDIVLPMSSMGYAELVQTRVGDSIVYNTPASVTFENPIPGVSDGEPYYGKIYRFPDGGFATEEDMSPLARRLAGSHLSYPNSDVDLPSQYYNDYGQGAEVAELNGELISLPDSLYFGDFTYPDITADYYESNYSSNSNFYTPSNFNSSSTQLAVDLAENGQILTNIPYTGLPGTQFDENLVEQAASNGTYGNDCVFHLQLDTTSQTADKVKTFYQLIYDLLVSDDFDTECGKNTFYSGSYGTYVGHSNALRVEFDGYWECISFLELKSYINYYSVDALTYIEFRSYNYEALEKLLNMLEKSGISIIANESYMPDFAQAERCSVKDYLNFEKDFGRIGTCLKKGLDTVLGKFSDNVTENTAEIITDTYDGSNISFSVESLDTPEKGVVYNVVNQVMVDKYYPGSEDGYYSPDYLKMGNKGNVYYLDGEFIQNNNKNITEIYHYFSEYGDYDNYYNSVIRLTEYKWGELVLVSRPDPVEELAFSSDFSENGKDENTYSLSWKKPVDEGFGTTKDENGKTITKKDDYVYLQSFDVSVVDENGKEVYSSKVMYDEKSPEKYSVAVPNSVLEQDKHYTAKVVANNVIGASEVRGTDIFVTTPSVEITMTPDQPVCLADDTVTYTETVTNTGKIKLTDVRISQSLPGEYEVKEGMNVIGTEVSVPNLEPGASFTFMYRVNADKAVDKELCNTAVVTTAEKVTDEAVATVYIINPSIALTKKTDSDTYFEDGIVTYTNEVTNTGDTVLKNVVVTEDNDKGEFVLPETPDIPTANIKITSANTAVIDEIQPGESVTLIYKIAAKDVEQDESGNVNTCTTAVAEKDIGAQAMAEYKILHPQITVTTKTAKTVYGDLEDIVYTDTVVNTGDCVLHNVVVSEQLKNGVFSENGKGTVNSDGSFVIEELQVNESVELTYTINAQKAPVINEEVKNTVTATCDENAEASDSTTVKIVHYEISVTKLVDSPTHIVGENVVFTSIIENTGNYKLTNIFATEDVPGEFNISDGAVIINGGILIASLQPGETYTYSYTVTYSDELVINKVLTSTVTVTASENALATSSGSVTKSDTNFTEFINPGIKVTKSVDERTYKIGETVVYTDTVTNTGDCDLTDVVVTESINGTFISEYDSTENSITIPKIAAGESVEIVFDTIIDADIVLPDNTYPCTVEAAAAENVKDSDTKTIMIEEVSDDTDSDTDTSTDSEIPSDTDSDIPSDTDTESDTDSDIPSDTDTESDTDSDIPSDTDTESDTDSDIPSDTDTESDTDSDIPSDTDTESDTDSDIPSDTDTESDTDSDIPSDTDTESDTDSDIPSDTDTESDTDSDIPSDTDTDSDTDSDIPSDTDTESDTDSDIPSDTDTDSDTDSDIPSDNDTDLDTDSDIPSDTDTDSDTDSDIPSDTDTDSDTDSDIPSDTDTDSDTDSDIPSDNDTDLDTDSDTASDTETDKDTDSSDTDSKETNDTPTKTTSGTTTTKTVTAGGTTAAAQSGGLVQTGGTVAVLSLVVILMAAAGAVLIFSKKKSDLE